MTRNIDFTAFYRGSTYVPFDVAMYMQKYLSENLISAVVDKKEDNQPEYIRLFNKCWSTRTYPCQNYNPYGARIVTIPKYNTNSNSDINHIETMTTWIVSALLTRIDRLCHLVSEYELSWSCWHGWFLVHLATKCFKIISQNQHSRDLYKKK